MIFSPGIAKNRKQSLDYTIYHTYAIRMCVLHSSYSDTLVVCAVMPSSVQTHTYLCKIIFGIIPVLGSQHKITVRLVGHLIGVPFIDDARMFDVGMFYDGAVDVGRQSEWQRQLAQIVIDQSLLVFVFVWGIGVFE